MCPAGYSQTTNHWLLIPVGYSKQPIIGCCVLHGIPNNQSLSCKDFQTTNHWLLIPAKYSKQPIIGYCVLQGIPNSKQPIIGCCVLRGIPNNQSLPCRFLQTTNHWLLIPAGFSKQPMIGYCFLQGIPNKQPLATETPQTVSWVGHNQRVGNVTVLGKSVQF